MPVRATMTDLIALVRDLIADPAGPAQQFSDQQYQDALDRSRDDVRYEVLQLAPSIVNAASTNNISQYVWADYYSAFQHWEADVTLQGYLNAAPWKVLTPVSSDYITGHWTFEANVFTAGTVPGQLPPVFATGKVYDPYMAAADLLEMWAAIWARSYSFQASGQSFQRGQAAQMMLAQARTYRAQQKPHITKATRSDLTAGDGAARVPLLGNNDALS